MYSIIFISCIGFNSNINYIIVSSTLFSCVLTKCNLSWVLLKIPYDRFKLQSSQIKCHTG